MYFVMIGSRGTACCSGCVVGVRWGFGTGELIISNREILRNNPADPIPEEGVRDLIGGEVILTEAAIGGEFILSSSAGCGTIKLGLGSSIQIKQQLSSSFYTYIKDNTYLAT